MADEMFDALALWLPQFNGENRTWADIPQPHDTLYHFTGKC